MTEAVSHQETGIWRHPSEIWRWQMDFSKWKYLPHYLCNIRTNPLWVRGSRPLIINSFPLKNKIICVHLLSSECLALLSASREQIQPCHSLLNVSPGWWQAFVLLPQKKTMILELYVITLKPTWVVGLPPCVKWEIYSLAVFYLPECNSASLNFF